MKGYEKIDRNCVWDLLNKIAIIGTIVGIPATVYGIYSLIYSSIVVYDMYQELNDAGGMTVHVGNFTRRDYKIGKKENSNRKYHIKGKSDVKENWK